MKKLVKLLNKKNRGFTLIELIVVIGILAILAALAIPAVAGYLKNSKARTNVSNAKIIYNASEAYLAANPANSAADIDENPLTSTNSVITETYLAQLPKTAGANDYAIVANGDTITVTWEAETDLAAENPDGTVPSIGDTLSYPQ